jgi:hypothetical protein
MSDTEEVVWIRYFKNNKNKWSLQPKQFTIFKNEIVKILQPLDLVWTGGSIFFYKFSDI